MLCRYQKIPPLVNVTVVMFYYPQSIHPPDPMYNILSSPRTKCAWGEAPRALRALGLYTVQDNSIWDHSKKNRKVTKKITFAISPWWAYVIKYIRKQKSCVLAIPHGYLFWKKLIFQNLAELRPKQNFRSAKFFSKVFEKGLLGGQKVIFWQEWSWILYGNV